MSPQLALDCATDEVARLIGDWLWQLTAGDEDVRDLLFVLHTDGERSLQPFLVEHLGTWPLGRPNNALTPGHSKAIVRLRALLAGDA